MKFGIFYEHQLPRPWNEDSERQLIQNALDQVELADKLGFDYVWEVEHHFLEEYSHSSAPEIFLAACSQVTKNIRLGHGIVQTAPFYNHPARTAERIATLDLVWDKALKQSLVGNRKQSLTAIMGEIDHWCAKRKNGAEILEGFLALGNPLADLENETAASGAATY